MCFISFIMPIIGMLPMPPPIMPAPPCGAVLADGLGAGEGLAGAGFSLSAEWE
jgi:hypothetical protein